MVSDSTTSNGQVDSQPPLSDPILRKLNNQYEMRIDSLGDLASLFICQLYQCQDHISGPYDIRKYTLDNFVIHILRTMKLEDDVLFGALIFIQRIKFRATNFVFNNAHNHAHKLFISAYILSAKEFARGSKENGALSSFEDYNKWSAATQNLFDGDRIRRMERATLKVLQNNKAKGLKADKAFDGLLPKFRSIVVKDYEEKWEIPSYPQSLATARPVFMVRSS